MLPISCTYSLRLAPLLSSALHILDEFVWKLQISAILSCGVVKCLEFSDATDILLHVQLYGKIIVGWIPKATASKIEWNSQGQSQSFLCCSFAALEFPKHFLHQGMRRRPKWKRFSQVKVLGQLIRLESQDWARKIGFHGCDFFWIRKLFPFSAEKTCLCHDWVVIRPT